MNIGPSTDPNGEMEALVQHLDKVHAYIDAGVAKGAELVVDGRHFNV